MAALPDSTWRENTITRAENKISEYLLLVNTPHGADATTHALHVREAEEYAADFRANGLSWIITLGPTRTAVPAEDGPQAQA